jgi:NAD(P)H-hydrate epimerase
MNSQPARRLAVDVPSGLDCDTGEVADVAVRADVTCTFVAAKPGLLAAAAASWVGDLRVVSIGVPYGRVRKVLETS